MEQRQGLNEQDLMRIVSISLAKNNNTEFDKQSTVTGNNDAVSTLSQATKSEARVKKEFIKD